MEIETSPRRRRRRRLTRREPTDLVLSQQTTDKSVYRISGFFLTINTNFSPLSTDIRLADQVVSSAFVQMLNYPLKKRNNELLNTPSRTKYKLTQRGVIPDFIKVFGTETPPEGKLNIIESIDVEYCTEIGNKYNRLHIHALFSIVHFTKLHIDVDFIRGNFYKYLQSAGWQQLDVENRGMYVHVKHVRFKQDEDRNFLLHYMKKGIKTKGIAERVEKKEDFDIYIDPSYN